MTKREFKSMYDSFLMLYEEMGLLLEEHYSVFEAFLMYISYLNEEMIREIKEGNYLASLSKSAVDMIEEYTQNISLDSLSYDHKVDIHDMVVSAVFYKMQVINNEIVMRASLRNLRNGVSKFNDRYLSNFVSDLDIKIGKCDNLQLKSLWMETTLEGD